MSRKIFMIRQSESGYIAGTRELAPAVCNLSAPAARMKPEKKKIYLFQLFSPFYTFPFSFGGKQLQCSCTPKKIATRNMREKRKVVK